MTTKRRHAPGRGFLGAPKGREGGERTPRPKITRHALTIAATTASERPVAQIERLKGGELVWSLRVPAATTKRAVDVVIEQAERLKTTVETWTRAEVSERLKASLERVPPRKEAS